VIFPFNSIGQGKIIDEVVAIVGKNPILRSDIENDFLDKRASGIVIEGDLKCIILEELLKSNLFLNQAEIDSIEVREEQIEQELNQRINTIVAQIGSVEKLEEYFNSPLQELKEELRKIISDQQKVRMMHGALTEDVKITPSEIQKFFKEIPKDKIPYITSKMELAQIVIYPKISDAEILRIKEKLRGLRKRIIDGERDMNILATMWSEDPGSNTNGGRYDDMPKESLDPAFIAGALKLKEGEISNIVKTQSGYHIIQLHDRKGDRISFSHILLIPKVDNGEVVRVISKLDSIADLVRNKKYTFEEAAKKYSEDEYTKKSGGYIINPQTGGTLFEASLLGSDINYAIKDMKVGEISDPFSMSEYNKRIKAYKIMLLKTKSKAHRASLKEDYQLIQDSTLSIKRQEVLDNWIREKQKSTYIKIGNTFKNCDFKFKSWIKN